MVFMWFVYMFINELLLFERKLKENIIYYGLWILFRKLIMWSFFKFFFKVMCELEDGVCMKDYKEILFCLRVIVLNCVCDLFV